MKACMHFVGFRGDEYTRAIRVFGMPDFIHPKWDLRARREIAPHDVVVFATGDDTQPLARFNAADFIEKED